MATFILSLFALALLAILFAAVVWAFSAVARFLAALLPSDTERTAP
ncbi:hypothetical protein [Stenotrophomonas sp. Iso1]|nr:hypothetical protein [Stenotrophomonas sp. Iso1]